MTHASSASVRLALTVEEAADALGVCENTFRAHILADTRCPRFFCGRLVRIPVEPFQAYLAQLADEEGERTHRLEEWASSSAAG